MSRARAFASVLLLGAAAFVAVAYARQAQGYVLDGEQQPEGVPLDGATGWDWSSLAIPVDDITAAMQDLGAEVFNYQQVQEMPSYSVDANVRAFLETIKRCEGTAQAASPYRVCFAYRHTVQDMSDHPAVTGEWRGEPLSDAQCRGAGLGPGCVSTAAGAYQIIRPTWLALKGKLGLPDFSPASQDAAAVQLLRDCGAFQRLAAGDLAGAVSRARRTWASLPGANYAGQGMRSMDQVADWYRGAGGYAA